MLEERQFEIGGVVFGDRTPVQVDDFDPGDSDTRLADRDNPASDGIQMGIDRHDSRLLNWELWTDTASASEVRAALAPLRRAWSADVVRATPRAVVPLRLRMPGSDTVVVYGRPRRMTPAGSQMIDAGTVDLVADFRCSDRLFYSDVEQSVSLSLIASGGGGIVWPIQWPITWAPGASRQDAIVNRGDAPTWPVITIRGPVAQPEVEFLGTGRSLRLDVTLAFDRSITVDTRPWARTVLRDDGASFAGAARGAALSDFQLPVGQTVLAYRGTDLSGQSTCTVSWRSATETP